MSTKDESRLARWSRLKRKGGADGAETPERGAAAPKPALSEAPAPPVVAAADNDSRPLTPEEEIIVKELDLPPVETLTKGSDFRPFMDKRVPEFLRRQALRKLWTSDPLFSFLDRMNEYDEDYSIAASLAAGATAYRPDKGGYLWRDEPKTEEETVEAGGAEAAPAAEAPAVESRQDAVDVDTGDEEEEAAESLAQRARRLQGHSSDVRAPNFTANPYYQAPGVRESQPANPWADSGDGVGEAEDDSA